MNPLLRSAPGLLLAMVLASPSSAQVTWHVDAAAPPGGDGLGWSTAFASIDDAFLAALEGDSVWVKAGTYVPTVRSNPAEPRSVTFLVPQVVSFLGGFDGTETSLDQRAGLFDQTILSGEIGVVGDPADNATRVVSVIFPSGIPHGVTSVDGFTIQDGYSNGQGAGVYMFNSAFVMRHCIVRNNRAGWGAGLHAQPAFANIAWCRFEDNHATNNGGAIWGQAINYKISHSVFRGNSAANKGGAVYLHSIGGSFAGVPVLISNSLMHDNSADRGGAIFLGGGTYASGKAVVTNSTIAFNSATTSGGGVSAYTGGSVPAISRIRNSIVWGNQAPIGPSLNGRHLVAYSDIEGPGFAGGFNRSVDPLFVDPQGRDLRLLPGSPANDAGSNALVSKDRSDADGDGDYQEIVEIDLEGGRRFADDPLSGPGGQVIVDMGAYEL